VVTRPHRVIWTESARRALDEVIAYIAQDSPDGANRVLTKALDVAGSLSTLAERGRVVPEIANPALRELLVYQYRLLYGIRNDRVVILAFLHGARDFSKWRREQSPEL
jgi:plasmid stabilization system protein ParE